MKSRAGTRLQKTPYSAPVVAAKSLSAMVDFFGKAESQAGHEAGHEDENGSIGAGTQPPSLVVDGFDGNVKAIVKAITSLGWRAESSARPDGKEILEIRPERSLGILQHGMSILVRDMRGRERRPPQPPGRVVSTGTLTLVLTDPGESFLADIGTRRTDQWNFRGPIGAAGLAVLVCSVFQICAAWMEKLSQPSPDLEKPSSKAPAVAYAEKA